MYESKVFAKIRKGTTDQDAELFSTFCSSVCLNPLIYKIKDEFVSLFCKIKQVHMDDVMKLSINGKDSWKNLVADRDNKKKKKKN
jgi:hypothetical protein